MKSKEDKEMENYIMLQNLVRSFNGRMNAHLHERKILLKEREWLVKQIDKAQKRAEKEEGNV